MSKYYLFLDRIKVQEANAISSPLTYGFPSINGIVGAVHALSRKIPADKNIRLDGVLIGAHKTRVHHHRATRYRDYKFKQKRIPLRREGRQFNPAPIIEEGRVDLELSLVIEVIADRRALRREEDRQKFALEMRHEFMKQRLAGGAVMEIEWADCIDNRECETLIDQLVPAYILMDATEDLIGITDELQQEDPDKTGLDALIEMATIHHRPTEQANQWEAYSYKRNRGWLVPIMIGYHAISDQFAAGEMAFSRSPEYSSQYVEPIYSLGKWIFPFSLRNKIESAFWRYAITEDNIYRLTQKNH